MVAPCTSASWRIRADGPLLQLLFFFACSSSSSRHDGSRRRRVVHDVDVGAHELDGGQVDLARHRAVGLVQVEDEPGDEDRCEAGTRTGQHGRSS